MTRGMSDTPGPWMSAVYEGIGRVGIPSRGESTDPLVCSGVHEFASSNEGGGQRLRKESNGDDAIGGAVGSLIGSRMVHWGEILRFHPEGAGRHSFAVQAQFLRQGLGGVEGLLQPVRGPLPSAPPTPRKARDGGPGPT